MFQQPSKIDGGQSSQRGDIFTLARDLEPLFQKYYDCRLFGHGTKCDLATIRERGLLSVFPYIDSIAYELKATYEGESAYSRASGFVNRAIDWPHWGGTGRYEQCKGFVLVAIPVSIDPLNAFEALSAPAGDFRVRLSSKYFFGTVDIETYQLVKNPGFEPLSECT